MNQTVNGNFSRGRNFQGEPQPKMKTFHLQNLLKQLNLNYYPSNFVKVVLYKIRKYEAAH